MPEKFFSLVLLLFLVQQCLSGFLESFSERHFFFFHLAYYNQDEIFIPLKNFLVLLLGFFQVSDFEKQSKAKEEKERDFGDQRSL